ncbi:MAG: hypothetical protein ACKV19_11375 [Verrucomicrobiales bacterium]
MHEKNSGDGWEERASVASRLQALSWVRLGLFSPNIMLAVKPIEQKWRRTELSQRHDKVRFLVIDAMDVLDSESW